MTAFRFMILLAALTSVAVPQTKVLLYDFEPHGFDMSVERVTTQLLREALNGTYQYVVVDPRPGTVCYSVVAAAESARVYNADQALIGNVMNIGGKPLLTYQLVYAAGDAVMLADKVEVAADGRVSGDGRTHCRLDCREEAIR